MNPPPPSDETEDEAATVDQENNAGQAAEKEKAGTKCKTKSQTERDINLDEICKLAQARDHQVELALIATAKQMIRTLNTDEQDKLFDEIQSMSSSYFREHHKRLKRSNAQDLIPSTSSVSVMRAVPPPPLTIAGQTVQSKLQHADINQMQDDVLIEVGNLPPMEQYNI